jgi:peptide/nickel transport system substrate-binding protein
MDVTTLDISRSFCDTCQIYNAATYETLVKVDPDDLTKYTPLIAASWEANADNTEFTFAIDPAAVFADGTAIEAKDVKWSFERLKNLAGGPSFMMNGLKSIETPDESTVVVDFEAPNSAFIAIVSSSYTGIINSDVAAENGATADADAATTDKAEDWFLKNSAGSGQFVLDSYTDGGSLVLNRNENYWGTASVFPSVTINEVADSSAQLQQLQQGDVDIAMQINFDSLAQLEGNTAVTTEVVDSFNFVYLALSPGVAGGEALKDPKVREAIKDSIDYDGVIDATLDGNGKKQASAIPNGFEGTADLPLPERDVDAATALLADAGYSDGLTLEATYPNTIAYGVDFNVMFQSIQQDLAEVGIDLELTPIDFSAWVEQITAEGMPVTAVYYAPDHPDTSQYPQYFAMVEGSSWEARSGLGVDENQTDLLATALSQSGTERTETYAKLGQAMMDDLIILPVANPQLVLASSSDITGMNYNVTRNLDLSELGLK